jgi:hypothetical protein
MVWQYGDDFAIDIPCESPPAWQVAQVIRRGMCSDAQQWCQQHADKAKERTA